MYSNFNDNCNPTFVLNSIIEEDLNLFKVNNNEDEKKRERDYRCSLNEIPDQYASETFIASLKNDSLMRKVDSGHYYFKRNYEESQKKLPNVSINNFDRPELVIPFNRSKLHLFTLDDLNFDSHSLAKGDLKTSFTKLACVPLSTNTQHANLQNTQNTEHRFVRTENNNKNLKKVNPKKQLAEKQPNGIKQKQLVQCNCKKSKCLRLYCECFAKGLICGVDCNCTGCHNSSDLEEVRGLVVKETLEKNPFAFKSKYKKMQTNDQQVLHSRGCNCSKTGCVKKYCECYNAGTGCSRLCRCSNCKNENIEINDDEVRIYYDRVLRKRTKSNVTGKGLAKTIEHIKKLKQK
jgi:hypothetical protein